MDEGYKNDQVAFLKALGFCRIIEILFVTLDQIIQQFSTYHKIVSGDSRQMIELSNDSVHLAITSPPYWQLKDYGTQNQIGFHDSYESYINNVNLVWKECYPVLHNGCRLCVNISDQFARAVYYGRYKVIPIREEIIKFCENIGFGIISFHEMEF